MDQEQKTTASTNKNLGKYQLTIKKGILVIVAMYACQLTAGIATSYFFKAVAPNGIVPIQMIGLASALLSGIMILLLFWWDTRRSSQSLYPQIGLKPIQINKGNAYALVITALVGTHFLAWVYRSIILPEFGQAGIIGGGSMMFDFIQENGGILEMSGFLLLALLVGPIMEEVVFRAYLQSALGTKLPIWASIGITSIIFTLGHSPMVLWPMYFMYSIIWGYIFWKTGSLKIAILIHILSNLFYAIVGFAGWELLA